MDNILPEGKIKAILQELFPDLETSLRVEEYVGLVHAFFVKFPSSSVLLLKWEKVSNAIAFYYQSKLPTEFETWNLYLFCITDGEVEKHIKYKVENDTVSSRKILVNHGGLIDEDFIDRTIEEHITNRNLHMLDDEKSADKQKTDFIKNPLIWDTVVSAGIIKGKKVMDEKNADILEQLERNLRNEI